MTVSAQSSSAPPLTKPETLRCDGTFTTAALTADSNPIPSSVVNRFGQCLSCGQQLFQYVYEKDLNQDKKKKLIFSRVFQRKTIAQIIPLSVPGLVERGQCLRCLVFPSPRTSATEDHTTEVASSDAAHEQQEGESLPEHRKPSHGTIPVPVIQIRNALRTSKSTTSKSSSNKSAKPVRSSLVPQASNETKNKIATYEGPYNSQGQKHGPKGVLVWRNGDTYKGDFCNDQRHGHGTLIFASRTQEDNGDYVGDWKHDQMHGEGTRRYPNGDVYVGRYRYGKRHGEGRFYYANGDLYWGLWSQNQMQGQGRYYYKSGHSFEGYFHQGKRTGKGKLQRQDGSIDIYQYINDQRVGQGVRWSGDRTRTWRLWKPHGPYSSASSERREIPVSEAVSLTYEIEQAAKAMMEDEEELMS